MPLAAFGGAAGVGGGVEVLGVHSAGHHRHPAGGYAQGAEGVGLVGADGQDAPGGPAEQPFGADAFGRAAGAGAEGVEGLHEGDAVRPYAGPRGQAGQPEVGMHHVGPLPGPDPGQVCAEAGHVRHEPVHGQRLRRTGRHVFDDHAAGQRDPGGQADGVAAGVHRDVVAARRQLLAEAGHVDVQPTGVTAGLAERARVPGHHGDPHRVTSLGGRSRRRRSGRSGRPGFGGLTRASPARRGRRGGATGR